MTDLRAVSLLPFVPSGSDYDASRRLFVDLGFQELWDSLESPMKKMIPAANPDAYVETLGGWRRSVVESLRSAVRAASALEEVVKWGHLVYFASGPVLLIRAEDERVLFGFWRGQRLRGIEPRLKPAGKYEMATLELREGMTVGPATVRRLTREAVALNGKHGDPRNAARPARKRRS